MTGEVMRRYVLFDMAIASDFPLPELQPALEQNSAEAALQVGAHHDDLASDGWSHQFRFPDGQLFFSVLNQGSRHQLDFPGTAGFAIDLDNRFVGYRCSPGVSDESLRHVLVDQVLPRTIGHQRALPVLHASAVVTPAGLLAFVGDSGAGKSTLAASFAFEEGYRASDDCLLVDVVNGCPSGIPSYLGLRLLPDSIAGLGQSDKIHQPVAGKHRWLPGPESGTAQGSGIGWPLKACFVLRGTADGAEPLSLRRLSATESLVTLIHNSFALDLGNRRVHAGKLAALSQVASQVPCYEITFVRDYRRLSEVKRRILHVASSFS